MSNTTLPPDIIQKIKLLEEKYGATGQDLRSYLDGLLYADYLTYWDYVRLDVLLSLQTPCTIFADEMIFIVYHQITELYFKLILHAIAQLTDKQSLTATYFLRQIKRINSYFDHLTHSFEVMIDGMDKEEFLRFRMALLPASGFQSVQYRMIEICCTDIKQLIAISQRDNVKNDASIKEKYAQLYWKRGAMGLASKKKTWTLQQFEQKYSHTLIELARKHETKNIWQLYLSLSTTDQQSPELIRELRQLDQNANVNWPLMHYKSAVRYLHREPAHIAATGGTNWQKYLPPKNQRIIFYPELWTTKELDNWGKKIYNELFK